MLKKVTKLFQNSFFLFFKFKVEKGTYSKLKNNKSAYFNQIFNVF